MLNKDKRSMLLAFVLGDGCLHYFHRGNKTYGGLTIDHGLEQADYMAWKAQMIGELTDRTVKVRTGHKGKSIQLNVCKKQLRAWRKFIYKDNKKSIRRILPFIRHPEFALAVWLMDDGYVESSITNNKNYSASLRIFSCDEDSEGLKAIQDWLLASFGISSKIRYQTTRGATYPFVKINCKESLLIWGKIREFVLQFKSMRYKFRYLEQIFQSRLAQPQTTPQALKT